MGHHQFPEAVQITVLHLNQNQRGVGEGERSRKWREERGGTVHLLNLLTLTPVLNQNLIPMMNVVGGRAEGTAEGARITVIHLD